MAYNVAVAGATGNVGRAMLRALAERNFPINKVFALASARSVGKEVSFGEDCVLTVQDLATFDFSQCEIGLFSPGGKVSAVYAPKAAAAGCVVIDNTSYFRMDPDIPLIVPEVNPHALGGYKKRNIIANPNCSTIQMLVALKPLHDLATIKRIVVSTYQSVSGAGKGAMDELYNQTRSILQNAAPKLEYFSKQIAFNVIPQIDVFMDDGATKEEWKMRVETQKILDPAIQVSATCVRVPVFVGHAEAVHVEFEHPITVAEARAALRHADGVTLMDDVQQETFVTPQELKGDDAVFVSRIRKDSSVPNGLNLWIVADNVRKGAATNSIQIAELLVAEYL